jgi:hypothetical protein
LQGHSRERENPKHYEIGGPSQKPLKRSFTAAQMILLIRVPFGVVTHAESLANVFTRNYKSSFSQAGNFLEKKLCIASVLVLS